MSATKLLTKKLSKDYALTIHITAAENRYLRMRKRETGVSISEVIRQEWLSEASDRFHEQRKKNQPETRPAPPPQ